MIKQPLQFSQALLNTAAHQLIQFLPKLAVGLGIIFFFWLLALIVGHLVCRSIQNPQRRELAKLLTKLTKSTLILIGLITALGTMGVNVSAAIAGLGLTGFALSFALKDSISNALAGFLILFYQPFTIEDEITISGISGGPLHGKITNVNLRYTTLRDDEKTMLLPNAALLNGVVSIQNEAVAAKKTD